MTDSQEWWPADLELHWSNGKADLAPSRNL